MCEFVSWIEKDGHLYYLTDFEVFSKEGKKVLKDCRHNDVLGHGAIRSFFGFNGGAEHEAKYFWWNTTMIPKEIAGKIKDFDTHWGKMFSSGCFMNDDLLFIIYNAPPKWQIKAFERLLLQDHTNSCLRSIIYNLRYSKKKLMIEVVEKLLSRNPFEYDLALVIFHAPRKYKIEAWKRLLSKNPSNDILVRIFKEASSVWSKKAKSVLVKRGISIR